MWYSIKQLKVMNYPIIEQFTQCSTMGNFYNL